MGRQIPWTTVEEMVALLEKERNLLTAYIEAVRAEHDPQLPAGRAAIILCQYLVLGSAKRATEWANELGWRNPSTRRGEPTMVEYTPHHVYDWLENPLPDVPPDLVELCRVFYNRQPRRGD